MYYFSACHYISSAYAGSITSAELPLSKRSRISPSSSLAPLDTNTHICKISTCCRSTQDVKDGLKIYISVAYSVRRSRHAAYISESIVSCASYNGRQIISAEKFHLSPNYLNTIFSQETGITLKNYIIQERINCAKDMLANTDKAIYDIALEVGYKTAHHFSVIFKKMTGVTPSKYRESKMTE